MQDDVALINIANASKVTYGMLRNGVANLSALLQSMGITEGSVITVSCSDRMNQAVYILCLLNLPYTISPLNPEYKEEEITRVLSHSGSILTISDDPFFLAKKRGDTIAADLTSIFSDNSGSMADIFRITGNLLIYTSGTTGIPKGVLIPYSNIIKNTSEAINAFGYNQQSVSSSILPLFHTFTLISDLLPVIRQKGTCIICPAFTAIDAAAIYDALSKYEVKTFSAVPIIFQTMAAIYVTMPASIEFVISGAAPLSEKVRLDYYNKFGHSIIPCYGLSETTCFATISPVNKIKSKAVGKPAGISIIVVDADNRDIILPTGEIGEIAMLGESVIDSGYFRDVDKSRSYNSNGYFLTGDFGYFDEEGYLYIAGRKKNMIIRGGKKVYLEDVDKCVEDMPQVNQCVSIGLVQADVSDKSVSFIVLEDKAVENESEIRTYIQSRLSNQHSPDKIYFVKEIPRTKTGKPLINELKALAQKQ